VNGDSLLYELRTCVTVIVEPFRITVDYMLIEIHCR
jgi:hypothetical protein